MAKDSFPLPMKYLYMGINPDSSDVALPISRLFNAVICRFGKGLRKLNTPAERLPHPSYNRPKRFKSVRATIGLLISVSEECFRQLI
jgi:hypothetical protein